MKILFLHLSDAHIKNDTKITELKQPEIVKAISQIGKFDECIIVFSGDLTHSGGEDSYEVVGKFIDSLVESISDKYLSGHTIHIMIVPGNHDNLISDCSRYNFDLEKYYNNGENSKKFEEDLRQLDNFFKFSIRKGCFKNNKIVDTQIIRIKDFVIKFNLINTAPFSLLGNGNRDKGMHYIPLYELDQIKDNLNQKYNISVMHHGPEWFCDQTKHKLYNLLNNYTDLMFVGHEHFGQNEDKIVNGQHIDISSGIALYGTTLEQGFNALILDTEAHTLLGYKYVFNGVIFKPEKVIDNKNVVFNTNNNFKITNEFQRELVTDSSERAGENYSNYFVFPSLETKTVSSSLQNLIINTEEKFFELAATKGRITIEGGSRTGKTTLSKYISMKLLEHYVVIYLTEDSFGSKKAKNVLRNVIQYEYGDNADIDEFLQLPREKKILVVDDSDKVDKKKWDTFLDEYGEHFGSIITFCGIDWNINIKAKTLDELTNNAFYGLKICPFYYIKREELIKKICSNYAQDDPSIDVEEKCKKINDDITSQIKYFQLTPDFIHQFVDYYLLFPHIKTQNETNVFSKVFVANITYRISKNTRQENDVDEILVALDYVAHYIHFEKRYQRISFQEFEKAVNEYKEQYDNDELNIKYVCEVAINSNIMKESSSELGVEFYDENLLAYFVAQHLNRICQNEKNTEELINFLINIDVEINRIPSKRGILGKQ